MQWLALGTSILILLVLLLFPIFTAWFILRNISFLDSQKEEFGVLFEEFKRSSIAALLFQVVFMARRTIFCLFLFFLMYSGTLQCVYFFVSNLLYIAYCAKVMPYNDGTSNFMLIFSEGCILRLSLLYFHFR